MKIITFTLLFVVLLFICAKCKPDLVVKDLNVTWDENNKKATAKIVNIGCENAGNFMVYFNCEEDPVSSNHRPQVSHNIAGLARGASIYLTADFAPLAHPNNNNLGNVFKITVTVDPKNMVDESDENNNVQETPIP